MRKGHAGRGQPPQQRGQDSPRAEQGRAWPRLGRTNSGSERTRLPSTTAAANVLGRDAAADSAVVTPTTGRSLSSAAPHCSPQRGAPTTTSKLATAIAVAPHPPPEQPLAGFTLVAHASTAHAVTRAQALSSSTFGTSPTARRVPVPSHPLLLRTLTHSTPRLLLSLSPRQAPVAPCPPHRPL